MRVQQMHFVQHNLLHIFRSFIIPFVVFFMVFFMCVYRFFYLFLFLRLPPYTIPIHYTHPQYAPSAVC